MLTGRTRYIVAGSALVHAVGLAWVMRHEVGKAHVAWRRRRVTASDLDGAMHTVWLEGEWRWITSKMTTEQREAAVAAVLRYSLALHREDPDDDPLDRAAVAWWEN